MEVKVNGELKAIPEGITALGLLGQLAIVPERVVVELNMRILKRAELATTVLKQKDEVEIVHFVGGGL